MVFLRIGQVVVRVMVNPGRICTQVTNVLLRSRDFHSSAFIDLVEFLHDTIA